MFDIVVLRQIGLTLERSVAFWVWAQKVSHEEQSRKLFDRQRGRARW